MEQIQVFNEDRDKWLLNYNKIIIPINKIEAPIKSRNDPTPTISATPPAIIIGNNEKIPVRENNNP